MVKSNEYRGAKLIKLPKIDYSKSELPEKTKILIADTQYEIVEESKLTWDGRQFVTRIPKEIAAEYVITNQNKLRFTLRKPRPNSTEKADLKIELV